MATYATDLTVLNACDSATGWSELPSPHAAGASPSADSENYFHNGTSISQATGQGVDDGAGIQFDNGSALTWTAASNWVVMMWSYYAAPTNLKTWANGGARIGIGSADNNAKFYNAMGNNFGKYPYGGWQCTAIDPEFATADFTLGTPGANYQNFAFLPNVTAKITKGSPTAVDVLRYGRGEFQVSGTGANFSGMATANDNPTTGRWGLFQSEGGSNYLWKGLMSLGLAATSVTFSDSNKNIQLEDTPRILAGFNKIEVNHASSSVAWTSVSISGRSTSITGSAPISPGDFEAVANVTIDKTSCTFTDMGTWIYKSASTIDTCIYRRCGQVTQGGAIIKDTIFDAPNVAVSTAAVKSDSLEDITGCDFISSGTGHAIELTSLGDGTLVWDNTLSGYDTGTAGSPVTPTNTGDEAIWVNVGSGTLTISVSANGTVPSIRSAGATVNVVANQVTLKVTAHDVNSGLPLTNARVWVGKDSDKSELLNAECDANGIASVQLDYTVDTDVIGWVREQDLNGIDYVQQNIAGTITSSGLTIAVQLKPI